MKKKLSLLLALTLVLGGCNSQKTPASQPPAASGDPAVQVSAPAAQEPVDLVFATMDVGTAIYTYSSAIANLLSDYLPAGSTVDLPTTSPGGLGAAYLTADGKSDLIILNDVGALESLRNGVLGQPAIGEGKVCGLVGSLDMPHVDVLVRNDFISKTGCESMEDLIAKKIPADFVIKQAGTMGELAFVQLVDALGTTEEEMLGWGCTITRTSTGNIKTAMQDGTADITVDHPPDNQANTVELTMNTPCTLWPLSENVRDYMEGKGWTKTVWAAGTSGFTGHDKDIETVSSSNVVVCRADLDEETAYQITKAICENKEALASTSSALKIFEPEKAWITLKDILHPGAVRYYTEMGYMK